MYEARKLFKIEYAHQLTSAFSTCCMDSIHGHSGEIEVLLHTSTLDGDGMCMDFGEIKHKIGKIVQQWDHALIMPNELPSDYLSMLKKYNKNLFVVSYNPTAENMAKDLYYRIQSVLGKSVVKVIFHETKTGYASYFEPCSCE